MPESPVPIALFELCCVAVIVLTLALMSRQRPWREVSLDYLSLAAAAFVGEDTCIELYRFYSYSPSWHARVHHVPLLIPLIWPLVVLSARDVARSLFPRAGKLAPLASAAVVVFDASLVEVLSVRAGLWSWAEPGHLGVPLIGILGWGYFALGASWALDARFAFRRLALVAVAPVLAHALILATWWGGFRWALRGELSPGSSLGMAALSLVALGLVVRARKAGLGMTLSTASPRLAATALFAALFWLTARDSPPLWAHLACVAIPYVASTRSR